MERKRVINAEDFKRSKSCPNQNLPQIADLSVFHNTTGGAALSAQSVNAMFDLPPVKSDVTTLNADYSKKEAGVKASDFPSIEPQVKQFMDTIDENEHVMLEKEQQAAQALLGDTSTPLNRGIGKATLTIEKTEMVSEKLGQDRAEHKFIHDNNVKGLHKLTDGVITDSIVPYFNPHSSTPVND